jgi:hypothetical protein
MRIERVAWIGTRTERFAETTRFFRDVMWNAPGRRVSAQCN